MKDTTLFSHSDSPFNRREFVIKSVGGIATLLTLQAPFALGGGSQKTFTVQEIIDLILKEGGLSPISGTVDTIKAGQPGQVVTGIVTTMFPTIPVIEEAAKLGANFIIAHEPSFYNHRDDADWMTGNSIQKKKQELLKKYGMAIWRFHDYCHSLSPDAVGYGVAKKANWLPYFKTGQRMLTIPSVSLKQLVHHLKSSLAINHVRVIGDLEQSCSRVALIPGAAGGRSQISLVETENPDVLIVGEVSEWETAEYIRDRRSLGVNTSLIILGHSVSEEPGMDYFMDWLQPKLTGVKITHLVSGDPFMWM